MTHPDLSPNFWANPGEVPGNGIDDDGNGFVDDINGFDFRGNDGNPTAGITDDHGTAVAGVVAAPEATTPSASRVVARTVLSYLSARGIPYNKMLIPSDMRNRGVLRSLRIAGAIRLVQPQHLPLSTR